MICQTWIRDPYMVVDFGMKNGTETVSDYRVSLVNINDENYLINVYGTQVVYLIEKPAFVDIDYTKLMLRWFLSPLRLDLESLTISFDGSTYVYQSGKTMMARNTHFVNDQEMDIDLFYSFYRLVTSAASDGQYLTDAVADGAPLMTITYNYIDPDKSPDVMTLYAGGTRRVNVDINGVIEFDMKSSFVDTMKLACLHTISGESIEENW